MKSYPLKNEETMYWDRSNEVIIFSHLVSLEDIVIIFSHLVSLEDIKGICFFKVNTKYISSSELKTSELSRARTTSENVDVFTHVMKYI